MTIDELKKLAGIITSGNETTSGMNISQTKTRIEEMKLLGIKPGDPQWFEIFSGNSIGFRSRKK